MIFVTVGTHEQPFNRLLVAIDKYAETRNLPKDSIVVQKGYSDYEPQNTTSEKMYSLEQMEYFYEKADIIITHGGPGSMFPGWMLGKPIVAVPRQAKFKEHVDNHQVEFCEFMEKKKKVVCVKEISSLSNVLDNLINRFQTKNHESKTEAFIEKFEKELALIFEGKI
ncbi:glycosyltransferase [Priestia megaterium]|uniref:glycosyltransferase n=1 Tax=Priestia megaterium TaxID=1404 RepID=UPI001C46BB85|nr:glycosyltransferase [Priestia megaterium]MBV6736457.1 multidrug MFS transporter [Priestia megaterium]MDR0127783.1 glycosyltransferase [Priestia megaterium]